MATGWLFVKSFHKNWSNIFGLTVEILKAKLDFKNCVCIAANEQGFAMLGDLKNVKPGTAAD